MSTGYQIEDPQGCYYLTLQVVDWIDIFSRRVYKDIIIDSFKYCIKNKGLLIHSYVIMSNHVHLIVSSHTNDLSAVIRDMKSHTSKEMIATIVKDPESRRSWMLELFRLAATSHQRNAIYQLWTHENHAIELYSTKFKKQKMDYIHSNPVRAGIVTREEDYLYSSAAFYMTGKEGLINIEPIF